MVARVCSKCIVPMSEQGIRFDKSGCCELCARSSITKSRSSDRATVRRYIGEIKEIGRGRPYDCLVGLSGGRDSSFLLYTLVKQHGLRCVAAYHRTPFTPDVIDGNVRNLVGMLGVPLIEMRISREKHTKFARKMVSHWIEKPDRVFANLARAPCKQHNHEVYKIAKKENIGAIVFGGNKYEEFQVGAGQSKSIAVKESKEIGFKQKVIQLSVVAKRGVALLFRRPCLAKDFGLLFKASVLHLNNRTP